MMTHCPGAAMTQRSVRRRLPGKNTAGTDTGTIATRSLWRLAGAAAPSRRPRGRRAVTRRGPT